MQNKLVLFVGVVLVLFGIFKPDLSNLSLPVGGSTVCVTSNHVADAPANEALLNKARAITEVLLASDDSTRKSDCIKMKS